MKKENDPGQKDMLETAARLLAGDGLLVVSALYRKPMTKKQLCQWGGECPDCPDDPEDRMQRTLERLEQSGIICRQMKQETAEQAAEKNNAEVAPGNICWQLTELGEELEEVFAGLERFGRLYEKLASLGLDVRETDAGFWADTAVGKNEAKGQQKEEIGTEETGASETKCRRTEIPQASFGGECERRHGWEECSGQFLFRNPHQGYGDWYFYGKISGETAAIYLITGEEYTKIRKYMAAGKNAADAGVCLYLKIEMNAADIVPQQEIFYVRAEDLIIQESVREF